MQITVKCYGVARAATERKSVDVAVDENATVADALDALAAAYPAFETHRETELVVMRDAAHVAESDAVADGDVLSVSNPPMVED